MRNFSSANWYAFFALVFLLPAVEAGAASLPVKAAAGGGEGSVPDVPGDDIFGFTSPTDVGNPGDKGFANENDGRYGKRDGGYHALNTKYEFSTTLQNDWWIGGSFFGAYNRSRDVTGIDNVDRIAFDGLSFEVERRIVKRSAQNPVAISLSVEPRWGRIDGVTGQVSNSFGAGFKLFADAVIVPDKLFWGANLQFSPQTAQDIMFRSHWLSSSSTLASFAVTAQLSQKFFLGAETRYLSSFDGAWLNNNLGNALYVGPTFLWRVTDKIVVNATWQPQVAGHAVDVPGRLDLDNFERAQYRFKLTVAY